MKNQIEQPWGEYYNEADLERSLPYFKDNFVGAEVIQKSTGKKVIISEISVHQFTFFVDGIEELRGFDIRLHIKGTSGFLLSKAIQTVIPIPIEK